MHGALELPRYKEKITLYTSYIVFHLLREVKTVPLLMVKIFHV